MNVSPPSPAEDERLWDELSHQQSREIQQHRALHQYSYSSQSPALSWPRRALPRAAHRTANEFQRFAGTVYDAATTAYREATTDYARRQHYATLHGGRSYLDDFGIPALTTPHGDGGGLLEDHHDHDNPVDNDFVDIAGWRRPPVDEGWGAAANLDLYCSSLYAYFYHRGLTPLVCQGVVALVTLMLTLLLSVVLFVYVDWAKLISCIDEATCESNFVQAYIVSRPFQHYTPWTLTVRLYILVFLAYTIFAVWSLYRQVGDALQAKWVFEERLGIPRYRLAGGAVDWDRDVVQKLMQLQASGEYRIAIHSGAGSTLDALVVANRILRKENFMVALWNRGLLDLSVPFLGNCLFCPSVELSLYFAILNYMFNHKYHVRPAFYLDPGSLRRRFILCGVLHIIFMPFLLFFLTLHFGLQNAYDWKSTKQYLGPRDFSLSAKWKFREFNELPHAFDRRLAPAYQATETYLKLFGQNEVITALGRILVFIGGSLGAVLIGFAAINDAILLHVKIADWNLLWYAGIVGVIYSAGKAMIPSEDARPRYVKNMFEAMDDALTNVATHTHYYPDIWRKRGWDKAVHASVSAMYQFKAQLFLQELLAAIVAPYTLCVSLPRCAEAICEFILATKTELPGAGEVCGFATFDFDKFNDESWEGRTLGKTQAHAGGLSQSILQTGDIEQATKEFPTPRAREGKMEKSFFSFKATHPQWKCPESGQRLVDRVDQYQREETAALSREQQLHIEAAARQLETLARLQEERNSLSNTRMMVPEVDDSHIPTIQASADAGAGTFPISGVSREMGGSEFGPSELHDRLDPLNSSIFNPTLGTADMLQQSPARQVPGGSLRSSTLSPNSRSALPNPLGLSSELRRILNMSTLDGDVSVTGSLLASDADNERRAERQYLWLQRYHAHLAGQERQERGSTASGSVREGHGVSQSDAASTRTGTAGL